MTSPCPWPGKARHATKRAAYVAIAALERAGLELVPLRCGDHWHATHPPRRRGRPAARRNRRSHT